MGEKYGRRAKRVGNSQSRGDGDTGIAGVHITSHDVARLAGVSQPTVSRALRNHPRVPESTRAKVRSAAKALGYIPSQLGRSLSTQATMRIAMVADLENLIYPALLGVVHDQLADCGYGTVLIAGNSDGVEGYEALLDRSVDGVILSTSKLQSKLPLELDHRGVPFVYLNRTHESLEHDSSTADDRGGSVEVAEFLLGLGHKRIGALLGPQDTSTSRDREQAFRSTLKGSGVEIPDAWVARSNYTGTGGAHGFREIMAGHDRPTAVFCFNDHMAIGALNAARELGLSVPQDITIIGFDDLDMAKWPAFDLSTVTNPLGETARRAAQLLVERISSGPSMAYKHEVGPTSLVLRGTHAAPA